MLFDGCKGPAKAPLPHKENKGKVIVTITADDKKIVDVNYDDGCRFFLGWLLNRSIDRSCDCFTATCRKIRKNTRSFFVIKRCTYVCYSTSYFKIFYVVFFYELNLEHLSGRFLHKNMLQEKTTSEKHVLKIHDRKNVHRGVHLNEESISPITTVVRYIHSHSCYAKYDWLVSFGGMKFPKTPRSEEHTYYRQVKA